MDLEDILGAGFLIGVALVVVFGVVALGTMMTGAYSHNYRCTGNIVEQQLRVWDSINIGGFDPIDGDPVGGCTQIIEER